MRRCYWTALGGLCLLAAALDAPAARAMGSHYRYPPKPVPAGKQIAPPPVLFTCEEVGYGSTAKDAEQVGLEKVQGLVAEYLAESRPDLGWTPSATYLRQKGVARADGEPEEKEMPNLGKVKVVKVSVKLTSSQLKDIEDAARTNRVHHRQGLALRGLGGVVALLLATLGCLRLEEATRGYFSRVFRGVAVVVVLVIAAGLLVIG
jgi:hypothetical protein